MYVQAWQHEFDLSELMLETCTVWRGGRKSGGTYGEEVHHRSSRALSSVPFQEIVFETFLMPSLREFSLGQIDRFGRSFIGRFVPLDIRFFVTFWKNYEKDPNASWLERARRANGSLGVDFMGTWIRNVNEELCFPCFTCINEAWSPSLIPLSRVVGERQVSACLLGVRQ